MIILKDKIMNLPITKPYITGREAELIVKPLETGWLVQGPYVQQFEEAMVAYTGAAFAVATTSCSTAQYMASRCIGLQPDDEVLVPAFTWISTANSAEMFGAKPVFVDIDIDTFNMDITKLEAAITPQTKALYPVNLFGLAANMPEIMQIAQKHGLRVVEDCACSLGGFIGDTHTGTFGDCGCFSFHPRKSISTGEGGMLITNDEELAAMARSLRDHGAVKTDYERHNGQKSFLLTEYPILGYNYRMTDMQGAMGVAQFEKVPEIMQLKKQLSLEFYKRLENVSWLSAPFVPKGHVHGYQAFVTLFEPEAAKAAIAAKDIAKIDMLHEKRNDVMARLENIGIATRQGTHAVHIQQYYRENYGIRPEAYIAAYAADKLSMALPFYPTMTSDEVEYLFSNLLNEYKG